VNDEEDKDGGARNERVRFDELPGPPRLVRRGGRWLLETAHSTRHSAKEIYRVDVARKGPAVVLRAWQRLVTTAPEPFQTDLIAERRPAGSAGDPRVPLGDRRARHPSHSPDDEATAGK
jgi:hypothetical protein